MQIQRWLEKHSPLLVLGWLALISYLQARGISLLAGAALGENAPSRSQPVKVRAPAPRQHTADVIIERNPFDSVAGPLGPRESTPATTPLTVDPLSAPQCDFPQVVIVTQARDPAWSVASLQTALELSPRDQRVGDHVAGKIVEFIGYNPKQSAPSVWLSSPAGLCQTSLFVSRPKLPSAPSKALPSNARAASASAAGGTPQTSLLSQLRVVPERKGGTILGVRLFGIRPGSLLRILGLENGDRLESINGFALGTPAQALAAYAQLRTATRLALSIQRRGQPLTLAYRID